MLIAAALNFNLHSTMYLFQRMPSTIKYRSIFIYIPLCIYFNEEVHKFVSIRHENLHSTMYLFQPFYFERTYHKFHHLHSTMYLFQPGKCFDFVTSNEIYIPLCIYFNPSMIQRLQLQCTFTFHYVSISTCRHQLTRATRIHLHSTMYLFQLKTFPTYGSSCPIYIPLCIYFNQVCHD